MKNTPKMGLATFAGAVVGGLLAILAGLPGERILLSAGLGALLVFALLLALKFRP